MFRRPCGIEREVGQSRYGFLAQGMRGTTTTGCVVLEHLGSRIGYGQRIVVGLRVGCSLRKCEVGIREKFYRASIGPAALIER